MGRMPKTNRVERTRAGGTWTEASFWSYLGAGLRRLSRRWPPIVKQVYERYRRPNESDNKRLKWEFWCSSCGEWLPHSEMQVDHTIPVGRLRSFEDLAGHVERLFCEVDGLTLKCKDCHHLKTHGAKEQRDED